MHIVIFLCLSILFPFVSGQLVTSDEFQEETAPKVATALAVVLIISFGLYVIYYSKRYSKDLGARDLENFLTARHSVGWVNIGWSFYASAVGSWVITGPAQFGYYGGVLSVVSYSFASAMPILLIAYFGTMIQETYPRLLSLSDFIRFRFGPMTQVLVVLVTLLNMSITATAEYTTLTSLYSDFVGLNNYTAFIVILIAITTLTYTTYGGLKASIITDRAQAAVSIFLVHVFVIYLIADFNKEKISQAIEERGYNASFEFTDYNKGFNKSGYSSLFTLPFSLSTATLFSEAFWQRSWAAADDKTLKKGAWMGSILIFFVVGVFGISGILVAWANLVEDPNTFNQNLFAFQVFSQEAGRTVVHSAIGVVVLLLGTTMSESAIDSLQNGVGASVNGALARFFTSSAAKESDSHGSLLIGRVVLILVNIPYIIVGLQKFNILSLFLVGNMVCTCTFFPIMLGFFRDSSRFNFNTYQRDFIPPLNFVLTMFATMAFAGFRVGSFSEGVKYAFWGNTLYDYEYFLFPLIFSSFLTFSMLGLVRVWLSCTAGSDDQKTVVAKDNGDQAPTDSVPPNPAVSLEKIDRAETVKL